MMDRKRPALEVRATFVTVGLAPMVNYGDDWPHPTYILGEESIEAPLRGGRHRTRLFPTYLEFQGPTRDAALDALRERLALMCRSIGFAGTAHVLIRSSHESTGSDGSPNWIMICGVAFTRWNDVVAPGERADLFESVDMGDDEEVLRHGALAHDVLES